MSTNKNTEKTEYLSGADVAELIRHKSLGSSGLARELLETGKITRRSLEIEAVVTGFMSKVFRGTPEFEKHAPSLTWVEALEKIYEKA